MPFNQLLLPLLGGYIFVNHTYITCYWASRHSKEHLVFLSAVMGSILLIAARLLTYLACKTPLGMGLAEHLHRVAPYDGVGTAVGAFLLGFVLRWWFNRAWPVDRAPLWHYGMGTLNQLETLLIECSYPVDPGDRLRRHPLNNLALGLVFWPQIERRAQRWFPGFFGRALEAPATDPEPLPVMLCMKNRKVYVGFVQFALPMRSEAKPYINIIPLWSGYRDKDTLTVVPTSSYWSVIGSLQEAGADQAQKVYDSFLKTIALDDIEAANLFDEDTFQQFAQEAIAHNDEGSSVQAVPDDGNERTGFEL